MVFCLFYAVPIHLIIICSSQWIPSPGSTLPVDHFSMAIGAHNKTITMIGGRDSGYTMTASVFQYDIWNDEFKLLNDASEILGNFGSHYTQIADILYIKSAALNTIHIYNLKSNTFTDNYITIPYTCASSDSLCRACLASTSHELFVVGGSEPEPTSSIDANILNTVYILDLTTDEWLENAPSMKDSRADFPCIIDPITSKLYSIGGYSVPDDLSSVEEININDITLNSWHYIGDLTTAVSYATAVIYRNLIYVIGGAYVENSKYIYLDYVHTINTISNEISILSDPLLYKTSDAAAIIIDDVLYAFGGETPNGIVNTWMEYALPQETTTIPTTIETTDEANTSTTDGKTTNIDTTIAPHETDPKPQSTAITTQNLQSELTEYPKTLSTIQTPIISDTETLSTIETLIISDTETLSTIETPIISDTETLTKSSVTASSTSVYTIGTTSQPTEPITTAHINTKDATVIHTMTTDTKDATVIHTMTTDTDTSSFITESTVSDTLYLYNTNSFDGADIKGNEHISKRTFGENLFMILVISCGVLLLFVCLVGIGIGIWCFGHKKEEKRRYTDSAAKIECTDPGQTYTTETKTELTDIGDGHDEGENTVNIQHVSLQSTSVRAEHVTIVVSCANDNNEDYDEGEEEFDSMDSSSSSSGMYDVNQCIGGETTGNTRGE